MSFLDISYILSDTLDLFYFCINSIVELNTKREYLHNIIP